MQRVWNSGGIYQEHSLKYCIKLQFNATLLYLTATSDFQKTFNLNVKEYHQYHTGQIPRRNNNKQKQSYFLVLVFYIFRHQEVLYG